MRLSVYEEQSLSAPSQGCDVVLLLGGDRRLARGQPCQPALFAGDQVAGNRTAIPTEWRACERMAAEQGMYFEIKRTKGAIRVAFCPMTPDIAPGLFYSLRAPQSTLWQLRALSEQKPGL